MKMIQQVGLTLGVIGALLVLVACGGATPTATAPVGAARGINTFIYIYTEN